MAVLAEDPLTCDLDRLKDIRIERTFLGGRQVFGNDAPQNRGRQEPGSQNRRR
jgi:hypothetical protein